MANEGIFLAVATKAIAVAYTNRLQQHACGTDAAIIGEVSNEHPGNVILKSRVGGRRVVNYLTGKQLPRIC